MTPFSLQLSRLLVSLDIILFLVLFRRQHLCSPLPASSFSEISLQPWVLSITQKLMTTNSTLSSHTPPLSPNSSIALSSVPQLPQIHYFKAQIPVHALRILRSSSYFPVSCRLRKPEWLALFHFLPLSSPPSN